MAAGVTDLPRDRQLPLVSRLSPRHGGYASILAAHHEAVRTSAPGYIDPTSGFFVFTATELWDRGACCHSGCRHCPYEDGPRGPNPLPPGAEGAQRDPGTL
jgi:hypothetical protein